MNSPTQQSITYAAGTKLLELAYEVSTHRSFQKKGVKEKVNQGIQINQWLQALDYSDVLPFETRSKITTCLAQIAGVYNYPIAPVLGQQEPPVVNIGGGDTIINNNYYSVGVPFQNNDVVSTETVDSFSVLLARGATWFYTVTDGTNQRSGQIIASWLPNGSEVQFYDTSTGDIGSNTLDAQFEVDFAGGSIRLRAITANGPWIVEGIRLLGYTQLAPPVPTTGLTGADNGLHVDGEDAYLGGTLVEDTTVDGDGYDLIFDGNDLFVINATTGFQALAADVTLQATTGNLNLGADNLNLSLAGELIVNGDEGASGQVFTSNGAGLPPTWETPTGGGGSPAGTNRELQLNNSGAFGAANVFVNNPGYIDFVFGAPSISSGGLVAISPKGTESDISLVLQQKGNGGITLSSDPTGNGDISLYTGNAAINAYTNQFMLRGRSGFSSSVQFILGGFGGTSNRIVGPSGQTSGVGSFRDGGDIWIEGGDADTNGGDGNGGDIKLIAGAPFGTGVGGNVIIDTINGFLILANIPTSSAGLPTGAVWSNGGVLTIV